MLSGHFRNAHSGSAISDPTEDGYSVDRIVAEYPDLRKEDIEAALRYGKTAA